MKKINDLECGIAGEHLVCADLLISGYRAFMTDQNCPYDIAVELNGQLIKVQVKTTRKPRAIPQRKNHYPAYMWHVKRAGKNGSRIYGKNEFDILALVALDVKKIAYMQMSDLKQTVHIRTYDSDIEPKHGVKAGKTFAMFPFSRAILQQEKQDIGK